MTAIGVSGTLVTAYLTGKASFEASRIIHSEDAPVLPDDRKEKAKIVVPMVWKLYIPAGVSAGLTIASILGALRVQSRRSAAITAAYSLSEKAFAEYKEKVVEQLGTKKEQKIRDEIAQDRVNNNPPGKELMIAGSGEVLCCELYTNRYFHSDMESLRKAQNDINAKLFREMYATLNDFYYLVGLSPTSESGNYGWESDKQMELYFSAVLSDDNRPCMTFEYNYIKIL